MNNPFKCPITQGMKINTKINVSQLVTMYYFDFTADYVSSYEYHDFWEFVYVDNGHVIATSDDKTYTINKGEIIFHKPNEAHSVKCDGVTPANIFIMTFVASGNAMKFFYDKLLTVPYNLRGLLSAIIDEMQNAYGEQPGVIKSHSIEPFGAEQMIKTYLEQFLILLKRSVEANSSDSSYNKLLRHNNTSTNLLVCNIIALMEENISKELTIEDICRHTNYGKSQICEIFKSATGKTIMQYFTELKINQAKMLMREKRLNNTQISDSLGFSSPQYFTRVFKQTTSMSPGEYKKSIKFR